MKTGMFLSACMMVKDEGANLERCLKSLKRLVDEIVVVDTGSTDNTVEIAKHFGARVFHHEWQNDFSLHRNQALSYARGQWCFIIDADEEVFLEPGKTYGDVRKMLQSIPYQFPAAAVLLKDIKKGLLSMQFQTTRFFRRGSVEYKGIVHNQPRLKDDNGKAVYNAVMHIKHYGYDLTPDQKAAKFKRTSTLLLKQIETGAYENMTPFFYLCQLCADNHDFPQAVEWGEKYWEGREKIATGKLSETIYYTMVKQYMQIGDQKKAYEWLERGVKNLPGDLDLSMAALEYSIWIKDWNLRLHAAQEFIEKYKQYEANPTLKGNRFVFAFRPEALSFALYHLTLLLLKEGTVTLSAMLQSMSNVPKDFGQGLMNQLQDELKDSLFPIRFEAHSKETNQAAPEDGGQQLTTMSPMELH
jgi:glycosyltransferase involved in cell wall biosynthesis